MQENLFKSPEQQKMHELIAQVQAEIELNFPKYQEALKRIDKYRGLPTNDHVKEINAILFDIQNTYNMIFPALYYIKQNAPIVEKIMDEFLELMKGLDASEPDILKQR